MGTTNTKRDGWVKITTRTQVMMHGGQPILVESCGEPALDPARTTDFDVALEVVEEWWGAPLVQESGWKLPAEVEGQIWKACDVKVMSK